MALAATLLDDGITTTNAAAYDTSTFATTAGDFLLFFILHASTAGPARLLYFLNQKVGSAPWNYWPVGEVMLDKRANSGKTVLECWAIAPKTNAGTAQITMNFQETQDAICWSVVKITGTGLAATPDFTDGLGTAPYHGFKCIRQVGFATGEGSDTSLASEGRLFSTRTPSTSLVIAANASRNDINGAPPTGWTELSDRKNTTPPINMQINKSTPGATGYSYYQAETLVSPTTWATMLIEVPVIGSSGYQSTPERAIYA